MAEEFLADWQKKLQQIHADEVATGQPLVPLMPEGEDDYIGYDMNAIPTQEDLQNETATVQTNYENWDPSGELGPNGEKLPSGAMGWDQAGRPFYGKGLDGWIKQFKYRMGGDPDVIGKRNQIPSEEDMRTAKEKSQDWAVEQLAGFGLVEKEEGEEQYKAPRAGQLVKQYGKAAGMGFMDLFQWFDDSLERVVGTPIEAITETAKKSDLPEMGDVPLGQEIEVDPRAGAQALGMARAQQVAFEQGEEVLRERLNRISPVRLGWNFVRSIQAIGEGNLTQEDIKNIPRESWQAARIQYSLIYDPMLKEQFVQRYRDGEDPQYIALQLENPVAEMIGEILVDGSAAIELGGKMLGIMPEASNRLAKASDIYGMAPEIRKASEVANTAEGFENVVKTVQKTANQVATGAFQHANKSGLQELLADAKKSLYTERVGQAMRTIASTFKKNPDDVGDIMDALVKVHSGNLDEVRESVVTLQHFGSEMLFSQASMELGYFLRKGLMNADGVMDATNFIDTLADLQEVAAKTGKMDDLINFADSKVKQATGDMFKTVIERAEAGEKVSSTALTLAKADVIASVPVNFVNQILASIYMGISPAYAMRNLMQNTIQIVIDKGWGTGLQAAGAALGEIPAWLAKKEHGVLTYDALEDIRRMGGSENLAALRGIGAGASMKGVEDLKGTWKKIFSPFLDLGGRFEQAASAVVVRNRMFDDMSKMLKEGRAIPNTADLIAKGIPEDTAKGLTHLMQAHWGDVDVVMDIYKDGMQKGYVTLFESGEWLDKVDKSLLSKNGWLEEIRDIGINANTKEELLEALDTMRKRIVDESVEAMRKQPPSLNPERPITIGFEDAQIIGEEQKFTGKSSVHGPIFNARMYWNERVRDLFDNLTTELIGKVGEQDKEVANLLANLQEQITSKKAFDAAEANSYRKSTYTIRDIVFDELPRDVSPEVLAEYWHKAGIPGEPPANLGKKDFFSALWENFFDTRSDFYAKNRDNLVEQYYKRVVDAARSVGVDVDNMSYYQQAQEAWENAKKFDNAVMWSGGEFLNLDENAQKTFNAIAKLANEYGVATLTETGKYNNKHMYNILKKYGDVKYDSIFDYSFDEAKKAFDNYADTKGLKRVGIVTDEGLKIPATPSPSVTRIAQEDYVLVDGKRSKITPFDFKQADYSSLHYYGDFRNIDKIELDVPRKVKEAIVSRNVDVWDMIVHSGEKGDWTKNAAESDVKMEALLKQYGIKKSDIIEYISDKSEIIRRGDTVKETLSSGLKPGKVEEIFPTFNGNVTTEGTAHNLSQQMPLIESQFDKLLKSVDTNWGKVQEVPDNPDQLKAVETWLETARGRVADARAAANATAAAERDFILHDYSQKRGFDRLLGYFMPFEFWYTRTYSKWVTRAFESPKVIAGYARYRRTLEKIHAGMPEWWRYQINTNELLGLDAKNPIYFNLEATLNPLNGLTGVDFNDPGRHPTGKLEWITNTLDDLGKFGPTTWTPFSWLTALALYKKGESEAAQKWAGRLIPGTAGVKAATHLMGIGPAGGFEADPFVHFLYGGHDPYEYRRIGRALGAMVSNGQIDKASAYDSAFYKDDENWEIATRNAAQARAWGQLASFFLGVGFKGRSTTDMQIDQFYKDYYILMGMRADLTSQEFRERLDMMHTKYPFMDTVLLSRKGGYERDTAYAYGVLGRIPPGQSDQLAEWAGVDYDFFGKFYDDKGQIQDWEKADRDTFMAAMMNIGTILDVPDEATQSEWTSAKNAYTSMNQEMQSIFGEDILEKINEAYRAEDFDAYLSQMPEVEKALDWKNLYMMDKQLLMTYYKGIDGINKFYRSFAYDEIEETLGSEIFDISKQYKWLKENGGDYKGFLNEHPELREYWDIWDKWNETIDVQTLKFGTKLPEMKPATIREGVEPKTIGEQQLFEEMQRTQPLIPWEQWQNLLPSTEVRNFMSGIEPDRNSLQLYAEVLGLDLDVMIEMIRESLPSR